MRANQIIPFEGYHPSLTAQLVLNTFDANFKGSMITRTNCSWGANEYIYIYIYRGRGAKHFLPSLCFFAFPRFRGCRPLKNEIKYLHPKKREKKKKKWGKGQFLFYPPSARPWLKNVNKNYLGALFFTGLKKSFRRAPDSHIYHLHLQISRSRKRPYIYTYTDESAYIQFTWLTGQTDRPMLRCLGNENVLSIWDGALQTGWARA